MKKNFKWYGNLKNLYQEFMQDMGNKSIYEIVALEQNDEDKETEVVIRLNGRFVIKRTPQQIILDDKIIDGLSPKAVRAITYLALLEKLSPEYHLISVELDQKVKEYIVTIKHKNSDKLSKLSASQISKNAEVVKKLSPLDANRIGYMAGVNDNIK